MFFFAQKKLLRAKLSLSISFDFFATLKIEKKEITFLCDHKKYLGNVEPTQGHRYPKFYRNDLFVGWNL